MEEFERRLRIARWRDQELYPSNCIGTALYLVGEIEEDIDIGVHTAYNNYFRHLNVSLNPQIGSLIAWQHQEPRKIVHCAVITRLEPLEVAHREGCKGTVETNQPIESVKRTYRHFKGSLVYYLPRRLTL